MPYVDLERRAARRSRRVDRLRNLWADKFVPPEDGRLIGPAFQSPAGDGGAAPDFGALAKGRAISRDKLRDLLKATFHGRFASECALRPEDRFDDWAYYAPSLEEVDQVVACRSAKGTAYETEIFDCEDFAYSLRADFARHRYDANAKDAAFAAGLIWGELTRGQPHAANLVAIPGPGGGPDDFVVKIVDSLPENFSEILPRLWLIDAADWALVDYIAI